MLTSIRAFALLISIMMPAAAMAADRLIPKCGGEFGLCGYVDSNSSFVIPMRFEKARPFRHGLAAVRIDGSWGFIERSGRVVIEPKFTWVGSFNGERAEAATPSGVGVIDRSGAIVIPDRFDRAIPFTDDVALVREKRAGGPSGRVPRLGSDLLLGRFRLYHREDGWLTQSAHRFRWFQHPRHMRATRIWASFAKSYRLMNASGKWASKEQFNHVQSLHDGLAVVRKVKWGAVDANGQIVIPLKFDFLSYFGNGYAVLHGPGSLRERKHGLVRSDGVVVAEPIYDKAERPKRKGGLPRVLQDGIWYEVKSAELIPVDDGTDGKGVKIASCPQGLQVFKRGARYHLTDQAGKPAFDQPVAALSFGNAKDNGSISGKALSSHNLDCRAPIGVRVGQDERLWTYVRPDGQPMFNPVRFFPSTYRFARGHTVVGTAKRGKNGKWGIINEKGRFTLPLGPHEIRPNGQVAKLIGNAVFIVIKDKKTHLIDASGAPIPGIESKLDAEKRRRALACPSGGTIVGDGERFGIEGANGKLLVAQIHRAISCFRNGVAWAPKEDAGQWCPIGPDGTFRDAPACRRVLYPVRLTHHSAEKFNADPFESSVLWVRAGLRYGLGLRETPPKWRSVGLENWPAYWRLPYSP